jgi:hypothetical protein
MILFIFRVQYSGFLFRVIVIAINTLFLEHETKDCIHYRISLCIPCSLVSQAYYKRKLSSYNFTVYSLSDGKGTCFLWNETEGQRGSCEIHVATCLHLYLNSLSPCTEQVTLFSDSCIGQNRNKFVVMVLMDFLEVNNIWMSNRDNCIRFAYSCHRCNERDLFPLE